MEYIVFTEIIHYDNKPIERWYYGVWSDYERANEVAIELGIQHEDNYSVYHCVCDSSEAADFKINNLPERFR